MKNKAVKQMICDCYVARHYGKVEFASFSNKLYAWHYPPVEGGWYIKQDTVSIRGKV
ncbi:hypothetical protein VPHD249_0030 [Vibrio phage D249]|nr:hypothetical protein SIPHO036v1_150014 [Vibrio phage 70E38.1]QZI87946.1 hypothetical protein SIPHO041v1_p0035 [Vibrio phage 234P1]QZI88115.1 hypothetical protein SIPHO035v1_p0024 [Vibrio phage 234P7B]QZI88416.1 hypothetical protein SIPHO082v1_p0139 [Vibrio phage 294E48.1]QZI88484.1 hypothetical protein SIPHO037v1_p0043 [Vibrio phage 70E35.2]QZI88667.1 hypothetical protein SIPHO039v1_p0038 [Vibrio phage 70E35.5a]QZI88853.1 hypothetical protein SIPHO040v1_p0040 [Vibrio phage 70E35.6]QZI8916